MSITLHGRPSRRQWLVILAVFVLVVAGVALVGRLALDWASDYDPASTQISDRMMAKKSRQLQRVLDGMLAHDYDKVARATAEIEKISESMEWFIAEKEFEPDRAAFRDSLHALQDAVETNNTEAAIRSADALVDSCMRCHEHLIEGGRVKR